MPTDHPSATSLSPSPLRWPLAFLLTAALYALAGWAGASLGAAPSFASPLYPSAGIALACVLVYGWRVSGGVALGAAAVEIGLRLQQADTAAGAWPLAATLALTIGLGSTLQALVGAALVKRFVRQPMVLSEPRDIALFFGLGALGAGVISASVGTAALGISGSVPRELLLSTWRTWWTGDALGAMIAAPVMLTLIGQPRGDWAPRRLSVGLSLTLATGLLAAAIMHLAGLESDREHSVAEREGANVAASLSAKLQTGLHALEAIRGVFIASEEVTAIEMRAAAHAWLAEPGGGVRAIGWSERVPRSAVPAFETRVRAAGMPGYTVVDRPPLRTGLQPRPGDDDVVAIRYIEPMASNAGALGVNALSIPPARIAIEAAARTDQPRASAGFRLSQDEPDTSAVGMVVYRAIYAAQSAHPPPRDDAGQRLADWRGVVFVTLSLDALLRSMAPQWPGAMCLLDLMGDTGRQRLAGPEGCERGDPLGVQAHALAFAGRRLQLRLLAPPATLAPANSNAWLFSVIGLASTALLGALLLTVTGRARRFTAAVHERTAALQQQVHEREQAEAAMRESEQRFRNIFNNVPIGVVYTDLEGRVKLANPRFCEMVDYSADDLLGTSSRDFTAPEDAALDARYTAAMLQGELPMYRMRKRYQTRSGRIVSAQCNVSLLRDERGTPQRIVAVVEDITEHLRLADAEHAREAAEASNQAKNEFLSRMSHELRTPLNAMLGFAQLLDLDQRHPLAPAQRPWVAQIQQAGWHLLEMINDVLDLSRIESGHLRLAIQPLDLPELLRSTLPLVQQDADARAIVVSQDLDPDARFVLGDATRVKQILTNLLSNAVKYNIEGGRIHLASRHGGERVELVLTDTGIGMTRQQLGELFQPFNRLGRERSALEGTGIGLVISKRLAELMGGGLRADSVAGDGSSFILTLPGAVDPDTVAGALPESAGGTQGYRRRLLHYIEDNETNVEVMRGILAQRPQVALAVSVTGFEGLAAIRASLPDVVLLDMHLPDSDGMALLQQLKDDPLTAPIPVVMVSADAVQSQIDQAMRTGAYRYLTKPVNVKELLAVVDELLNEADTRFL